MDLRLAFSPSDNQKLGVGLESQIEPWLATRHQVQMPRNATGPIDAVTATISRNQAILNLWRPQGHGRNKTEEYEAPGGREYRGSPSEAFNYWRRTRCSFLLTALSIEQTFGSAGAGGIAVGEISGWVLSLTVLKPSGGGDPAA